MSEYCKDCYCKLLFTSEVDYCINCQNIRNMYIDYKLPELRKDND